MYFREPCCNVRRPESGERYCDVSVPEFYGQKYGHVWARAPIPDRLLDILTAESPLQSTAASTGIRNMHGRHRWKAGILKR